MHFEQVRYTTLIHNQSCHPANKATCSPFGGRGGPAALKARGECVGPLALQVARPTSAGPRVGWGLLRSGARAHGTSTWAQPSQGDVETGAIERSILCWLPCHLVCTHQTPYQVCVKHQHDSSQSCIQDGCCSTAGGEPLACPKAQCQSNQQHVY